MRRNVRAAVRRVAPRRQLDCARWSSKAGVPRALRHGGADPRGAGALRAVRSRHIRDADAVLDGGVPWTRSTCNAGPGRGEMHTPHAPHGAHGGLRAAPYKVECENEELHVQFDYNTTCVPNNVPRAAAHATARQRVRQTLTGLLTVRATPGAGPRHVSPPPSVRLRVAGAPPPAWCARCCRRRPGLYTSARTGRGTRGATCGWAPPSSAPCPPPWTTRTAWRRSRSRRRRRRPAHNSNPGPAALSLSLSLLLRPCCALCEKSWGWPPWRPCSCTCILSIHRCPCSWPCSFWCCR